MPQTTPVSKRICLLTGPPGCGKTTLLSRLVPQLSGVHLTGFLTEEIHEQGKRMGFMARGFNGQSCVLAHRRIRSSWRVGAYGVDVPGFEKNLAGLIHMGDETDGLFVIDEIGKMELLSSRFRAIVTRIAADRHLLLATIPAVPPPFVQQLTARPDACVVLMEPLRRAEAASRVAAWCIEHGLGGPVLQQWAAAYDSQARV